MYWRANSRWDEIGFSSYQIVLNEGSTDILFNYGENYGAGSGGINKTMVGIENSDGSIGLRYPGFDKPGQYKRRSVRFYVGSTVTDPDDIDNDKDNYTENQGDCDDNDSTVHPGAKEICGDGIDNNCNGRVDEYCNVYKDEDGDHYTSDVDCNDNNPNIHPGAKEICGDGIDNNCNGRVDEYCNIYKDEDGDHYTSDVDCNDNDPTVHPGAKEICGDGIDNNCNGRADEYCGDDNSEGPDDFGYRYITSDDTGGPVYEWETFTDNASRLSFRADSSLQPPIPTNGFFYKLEANSNPPFEFYGEKYNRVYIAGNGYLVFNSKDTNYENITYDGKEFPAVDKANNLIAPLWLGGLSDADASALVNVIYETLGDEPQRRFVMQFNRQATDGQEIAYQVVFYENQADIRFNYKSIGSLDGELVVGGIENNSGTIGLRYAGLDKPGEVSERSVLFFRGDPPVPTVPEPGSGRTNLIMPLVMTGNFQTSVTLLNDSSTETVTGILYGHESSGEVLVSSEEVTLAPLARYKGLLNDYFGEFDTEIAYLSFVADIDAVVGSVHLKVDGQGLAGAYPALSHAAVSNTLYLSHLKVGNDGWGNIVSLVNTSSERCTVSVEFDNGATKSISLQPGQQLYFYPVGDMKVMSAEGKWASLKNTKPTPTNAVIKGGKGLVGVALYHKGEKLSALALDGRAPEQIIYPYLLDSFGWWGGLVLQNTQSETVDATFSGYHSNGGGAELTLNSSSLSSLETQIKLSGDLLTSGSGWLQIDAASPVAGAEFFGTLDGKQMASISTGSLLGKSGIFSSLRSGEEGGWDGLVLVNPGVDETPVTLLAYNDAGKIVAAANPVLPAHGQLVSLISTLFKSSDISSASFIRFAAENDIVGLLFNGRNYKVNGYPMGELEALPALRLATTGDRY